MNKTGLLTVLLLALAFTCAAQQRLNKNGMTYLVGPKPNNIVYNDSVFRGSNEFKHLFFRTGDSRLIGYYEKHQANKIAGQVCGLVGAVGILIGINQLSGSDKGLGWALIGGGFAASVTGGYFTMTAQKHLVMAVTLFNSQYNRSAAGIGVSRGSAGLVYNF
jgi:hypothetical protein